MRVIGTAGHVDHGKSALIAALTGTHPDRLKEEQEREMTIDLGFGWLTLPDGEEIGIVDVPGHRDFIENMLSGIAGIDAVLLIIAADEGVMPQTREHLAILDLLQIPAGLIALTKTDLITDPEWLALIEADIRNVVKGTVLQDAPILRVSAKTQVGLQELLKSLSEIIKDRPQRLDLGRPRLPIDRVFSMSGFGTVVTGTLIDGELSLGDEVVILPSGRKGRIRGLQTHKKKEQHAVPGSRTAVNITGISVDQIERGEVLALPGQYQPTRRLDARLQVLKEISSPLKHGVEVKVFLGASERMAALRLLDVDTLGPAAEGWVQLELREPVVAVRGDRFIIRRPSPGETLGGGVIIDHEPKGRHKRLDRNVLKSLASLAAGSPSEVLLEAAIALNIAPVRDIVAKSRLDSETSLGALEQGIASGDLVLLEDGELSGASDLLVVAASRWNPLRERMLQMVTAYHSNNPLRRGIPREELKSKLKLTARQFTVVVAKLIAEGVLSEAGSTLAMVGHEIRLTSDHQSRVQGLMRYFEDSPFAPPSVKECQEQVGADIYGVLIDQGTLIQLSNEVVFRTQDYEQMVEKIRTFISENGRMSVADARDLFGSSRKFMLALLEFLDVKGLTMREGDYRTLRK
jgi:selenocysteine-specific elongation factor